MTALPQLFHMREAPKHEATLAIIFAWFYKVVLSQYVSSVWHVTQLSVTFRNRDIWWLTGGWSGAFARLKWPCRY